jgi:hypothetical protein
MSIHNKKPQLTVNAFIILKVSQCLFQESTHRGHRSCHYRLMRRSHTCLYMCMKVTATQRSIREGDLYQLPQRPARSIHSVHLSADPMAYWNKKVLHCASFQWPEERIRKSHPYVVVVCARASSLYVVYTMKSDNPPMHLPPPASTPCVDLVEPASTAWARLRHNLMTTIDINATKRTWRALSFIGCRV